ncbi:MAG: hypothetical protein P8J87_06910 [Verrucomicrobiales bacterium]|nr:hypothetical protein [Verrucomicrobiales bacterium]
MIAILKHPLSLLSIAAALSLSTNAQDTGISRRDVARPVIPPVLPGTTENAGSPRLPAAPSLSPTSDYGEQEVLVPAGKPDVFNLGINAGFDFQSNAPLSPFDQESDTLWRQSASLRATVPLSPALYFDAGLQQQTLRYDEFEFLDFDRIDTGARLLWALPGNLPAPLAGSILSFSAAYYRLSEAGHPGDELLTDTSIGLGLLRIFSLNRNQNILVSTTADVSVDTTNDLAQRHEYAAVSAWVARWTPHWETNLFGRAALYDYDQHDDWNLIAGAGIDWIPHPNVRIGISASYALNESDDPLFSYRNATVGTTLRASISF